MLETPRNSIKIFVPPLFNFLTHIILTKLVVDHGCFQVLEDRDEDSVVEGQVVVSMCVDEPPGQGRVGDGQVALDGVLAEDGDRVPAEGAVPSERLGLAIVQLVGEQDLEEVAVLLGHKVLVFLCREAHADTDVPSPLLLLRVGLRLLKRVPFLHSRRWNILRS